jgi:hypothetical protein
MPVPTDRSLKTLGDMKVNLEYTDISSQFYVQVALLSAKELSASLGRETCLGPKCDVEIKKYISATKQNRTKAIVIWPD